MLRRPSQAGSPKLDPTSVVYGFSPHGGRYTINLKQALNTKGSWRSCDSSDNRCQTIQDPSTFQLNLKAGQFKVLVLTPSKG
jgi:hypothetical protein